MKAIDLFAGAGGFSLAAHQAGISVVAAVEFNMQAAKTYQTNLIDRLAAPTKLYAKDINTIDISEFMTDIKLQRGELDLLLGGPPCQGFSGHRLDNNAADDPRNKLLVRYFDFVKALQPKIFLVENVPGLLWQRHKQHLDNFLSLATNNGYQIIGPMHINAKDFGVPQNRKRVFILGVRSDMDITTLEFPPKPTHFKTGEGLPTWLTASTVFEPPPQHELKRLLDRFIHVDKIDVNAANAIVDRLQFGEPLPSVIEDPCAVHMQHNQAVTARFADMLPNGSRDEISFRLKCHANGYRGHKDVYGRVRYHLPGPTMTTGCNNPSKGRFVHLWLNHGITLRHAARFQTFPNDYQFIGNNTEQARQIGNAVPVKLGLALINAIKKQLISLSQ